MGRSYELERGVWARMLSMTSGEDGGTCMHADGGFAELLNVCEQLAVRVE